MFLSRTRQTDQVELLTNMDVNKQVLVEEASLPRIVYEAVTNIISLLGASSY